MEYGRFGVAVRNVSNQDVAKALMAPISPEAAALLRKTAMGPAQ
jgi:hypothetical protein